MAKNPYPTRPYDEAKADPKDIAKAESRSDTDQIADYHDTHPTLKRTKKEQKEIEEQQQAQVENPDPADKGPQD